MKESEMSWDELRDSIEGKVLDFANNSTGEDVFHLFTNYVGREIFTKPDFIKYLTLEGVLEDEDDVEE